MTGKRKIYYLCALLWPAVILFSCAPPKQDGRVFPLSAQRYWLPKYDSLEYFNISPDGGRFLAVYKIGDKWYAQINKIVYKNFQGTFLDSFAGKPKYSFSSDGSKVGLVYQKERPYFLKISNGETDGKKITSSDTLPQWFVQMNQVTYGGFDGDLMPEIKYSPDGKTFGFVFKRSGLYYVRLNDDELGPFPKADLAISPDGRVSIARIEKGYVLIEEIEMIPNPRVK